MAANNSIASTPVETGEPKVTLKDFVHEVDGKKTEFKAPEDLLERLRKEGYPMDKLNITKA